MTGQKIVIMLADKLSLNVFKYKSQALVVQYLIDFLIAIVKFFLLQF